MNSIADRLKYVLSYYQLNAAEFAEKLGIQKSSISHLLSGRNKPSFQFLSKMAKTFPEINLTWFITGDGDIFNLLDNNSGYAIISEETDVEENESFSPPAPPENKKKLADDNPSNASQVNQIIMVYDDDTFKILNKS